MPTHLPPLPEVDRLFGWTDIRDDNGRLAKAPTTVRSLFFSQFLLGQQGKFEALRNAIMVTWPEFVEKIEIVEKDGKPSLSITPSNKWNPWLERCLRAFTNEDYAVRTGDTVFRSIILSGCGGGGKTFSSGLFSLAWWCVQPENSIAILTSTTKEMIRHRIWPVISHYWQEPHDLATAQKIEFGHMIDSQTTLLCKKGNYKNSVFAQAVACGETQKALHNLKGQHAERMLVVIDEANGTPEAIFDVIPNWRKACKDFTLIVIGNPCSRLDPHGRLMEPIDGWSSINQDKTEWRTKAIPEWQIESGVTLRFDGKDSPNVAAGKNLYPYIYNIENWQNAQKPENYGTFNYWTQDRGLHPPSGFQNTVFNELLVERCEGREHLEFVQERQAVAFLDSAFGGNACVLSFGQLGDLHTGKMGLQAEEELEVPIDPELAAGDVDYQIARRVMEECRQRKIQPHCFGLDATGIGRGVAAIIAAEWSPQIHRTEWGTAATERASSQNDGRPAKEVYFNFRTEMYFSAREALEAGQMKGFSIKSILDFCSLQYEMAGKKYKLESKEDFKVRMRRSPDSGDACVGLLEVARRNGLEIQGKVAQAKNVAWDKQVQAAEQQFAEMATTAEFDGGWAETSAW